MQFPGALVFVLAVGILSYNTARAKARMNPQGIVPYYLNNVLVSTFQDYLNYRQNAFNPIVIQKCLANGGYNAHSDAIASLESFKNSLDTMANKAMRDYTINASHQRKPRKEFAKICRISRTAISLSTQAFEPVKRCLTQEEQQRASTGHNYIINILNYVCENNGSRALSFWRARGVECLLGKTSAISSCAAELARPSDLAAGQNVDEVGSPWSYPLSGPNLGQCRMFDTFRNCFLEQLRTCKKTTPFEIMKDVLNFVITATGCDNLLATEA